MLIFLDTLTSLTLHRLPLIEIRLGSYDRFDGFNYEIVQIIGQNPVIDQAESESLITLQPSSL